MSVIRHKIILSLASTKNLSIADARKRISDSSFNSLSPFNYPRFDFGSFPNLPQRQQASPPSHFSNRSRIDPNPFSVLANLPPDFEAPSSTRGTFSLTAALSSRAPSHYTKRLLNLNIPFRHIPRSEDPRTGALVFPNGRNPYNKANTA